MNKTELIKQLSKKLETTEKEGKKIINTFIDVVRTTLLQDEKILITGFGTFEAKISKERESKHPRTGMPITISSKKNPCFKMSKKFKYLFNQVKKN
ncbi:HU family DNA-binding protein [Candidatus Phytoplasma prunorum]|uniref:HU family DNA-binding protein n=1 Tax=Candidatus Phytoplasma prunorum TaxID=47565 RepID=UPI002FF40186